MITQGDIVYLVHPTDITRITYIKYIELNKIVLENGLELYSTSLSKDTIIKIGELMIKFK